MNYIAAMYKFQNIENPILVKKFLTKKLKNLMIYGTILIGKEGINGTISSNSIENLSKAIAEIKSIKGFKDIDLKFSESIKNPFIRLKVKQKNEIVTIGDKSVNPKEEVGTYIEPREWNRLIKNRNTILIDTRNDYEYSIGTFQNSINPETSKFSEFPEWLEKQNFSANEKKNKNIAMFCTGGIRCEKASSLMKNKGFKNVYHLKGGILKYFETIDENTSLWQGECFVFDDRVSVKQDLSEGTYDMCHGCRMPITEKDKFSKKYIKGVACPKCFDVTTDQQKSRFANRQKQVDIAKKRNKKHIGPKDEIYN